MFVEILCQAHILPETPARREKDTVLNYKEYVILMKLTFLGGADEVGASCTLLEIAGRRILVDCGIRMTARAGDTIPWLAPIAEGGGLDAIILTHAHMDHIGALPVIHQSYPHLPIYMTAASLTLGTILLMDSLKIMQSEMEREGEIPLYPLPAVEMMIGSSRPVAFGESKDILDGDVRITFYPAGHIMGAAAVFIEGDDGTVMMSGDISVGDQKTIPGMLLPPVKPDVMVAESTYGGRLHASRSGEEYRLVQQVGEVLERRGSVLFPAFAVGRSQEVILILSQAMEHKKIPHVPIFVDGMVRAVCQAYASYPELMTPWLRKKTKKRGHPFFYPGGPAQIVSDPRKRDACTRLRPSIIVASSGMLTGGASPIYAQKLASDPASFISITGYQDEESPGRQVQEVAKAGGGMLRLGSENVVLECGVGTYGLSAHADTAQIVGMVSGLEPREVALVHGDHGAREALRNALGHAGVHNVHLPTIGYVLEYKGSRRQRKPKPQKQRSEWRQSPTRTLHFDDLEQVAETLLSRDGVGRLYTVQEILLGWGAPEAANDPSELERISRFVGAKASPFRRDKKRQFLYRIKVDSRNQLLTGPESKEKAPKPETEGPMDPFNALQRVDQYLGEAQGLYKRSTQIPEQTVVLSFYFPKRARQEHKEVIERIAQETGWTVTVRESPHQNALIEAAENSLPEGWTFQKRPSIHLLDESVSITLSTEPAHDKAQEAMAAFTEKTGFKLRFKGYDIPQPTDSQDTSSAEREQTSQVDSQEQPIATEGPVGFDLSQYPPRTEADPMEINHTYHAIRQALQHVPAFHQPLKVGKKGNNIEVAFVSPYVGEKYADLLETMAQHTGWPIQIRQRADQHRIKEYAKRCALETWELQKEPGFHQETQTISLQVRHPPTAEEFRKIARDFEEATGFKLALKLKR